MSEINDLNITDASNVDRFPENQAPGSVNDGGRALEGLLARWHKDINGSLVSGGSANVYTLSANRTVSAYYDGLSFTFEANFANTGAATLNVDSVGAQAIVWPDGTALIAGDIPSGAKVSVSYDNDNTRWMLISTTKGTPTVPSFQANKNGTQQTGITASTATKLTFTTEAWDTHGWYDTTNSRYLPLVAGKYLFSASAYLTANVVDTAVKQLHFYKNGTGVKTISDQIGGNASQSIIGSVTIDMDGAADYVEAWVEVSGAGDKTVSGSTTFTWFEGRKI